ncbi:MAG: hypothetical protein KIT84_20000 [Labilithrix sp.]|nr:hypothetical protein [Labilithrix sp.]MCW5813322.1 hypothetical protein [Labilithrix sp.]
MVLNGKEPLRTEIDTGWMPSCDKGREHCNKGLQVRANVALTATAASDDLFTASLGRSATVVAAWPDSSRLELTLASGSTADSTLAVRHTLTPQVELYVDIGPFERGFTFPATRLVQMIPGAKFDYEASARASFAGWGFGKASVTVPAPPLADAQLLSVQLDQLADVIGNVTRGTLSLHAQASPTVVYRTTKVMVSGVELHETSKVQLPFPPGDHDYLDLPATIEGELSASGDLDVLPAATLANIGDMQFNPPATITFSSVKVRKHFETEAQRYVFEHKTVHIPLPNMSRIVRETDGAFVKVGTEGRVPAIATNTGEAPLVVRLESDDPLFEVPSAPIEIAPKSERALDVVFRPSALGRADATIKVTSNDPDMPELTFHVTGDGANETKPRPDADGDDESDGAAGTADEGCGCRAAGRRNGTEPTLAALGGLALAAALGARRRKGTLGGLALAVSLLRRRGPRRDR